MSPWAAGQTVVLHGFKGRHDLQFASGTLMTWQPANQRWQVQLTETGEIVSVVEPRLFSSREAAEAHANSERAAERAAHEESLELMQALLQETKRLQKATQAEIEARQSEAEAAARLAEEKAAAQEQQRITDVCKPMQRHTDLGCDELTKVFKMLFIMSTNLVVYRDSFGGTINSVVDVDELELEEESNHAPSDDMMVKLERNDMDFGVSSSIPVDASLPGVMPEPLCAPRLVSRAWYDALSACIQDPDWQLDFLLRMPKMRREGVNVQMWGPTVAKHRKLPHIPSLATMRRWVQSRPDDAVKVMDIDQLLEAGASRTVLAVRLRYGDGYRVELPITSLANDVLIHYHPTHGIDVPWNSDWNGEPHGISAEDQIQHSVISLPAWIARISSAEEETRLQVQVDACKKMPVADIPSEYNSLILDGDAWFVAYYQVEHEYPNEEEDENEEDVIFVDIRRLWLYALPTFCADDAIAEAESESD